MTLRLGEMNQIGSKGITPKKIPPVFIASSNVHKLQEFATLAGAESLLVQPLPNLDVIEAPAENGSTFEQIARDKAEYYSRYSSPDAWLLADDSGLEVRVLNGAPGIHSARYALAPQPHAHDVDAPNPGVQNLDAQNVDSQNNNSQNNAKLLHELARFPADRWTARFVCVIAVAQGGIASAVFHGEVQGAIIAKARGSRGFGYDPLFLLPRLNKTMAELSTGEKSALSHRGEAFRAFLRWFSQLTS